MRGINNECIVTLFLCQLLRGVMEYDGNPHNAPIFRGYPYQWKKKVGIKLKVEKELLVAGGFFHHAVERK